MDTVTERVVTVGLDVGQKADPSAVCVVEAQRVVTERGEGWILPRGKLVFDGSDIRPAPGKHELRYVARHVERLPLMTPYPAVASRVAQIIKGLRGFGVARPRLLIDSTGVGGPVVELITDALRGQSVDIVACTFTHGQNYTQGRHTASVGKAHLVSRLQALLQTRRLKLPDTPEAKALARELETYEIKVSEAGSDTYGAFKTGTHDDLATALGLAVLDDPFAARVRNAVGSS